MKKKPEPKLNKSVSKKLKYVHSSIQKLQKSIRSKSKSKKMFIEQKKMLTSLNEIQNEIKNILAKNKLKTKSLSRFKKVRKNETNNKRNISNIKILSATNSKTKNIFNLKNSKKEIKLKKNKKKRPDKFDAEIIERKRSKIKKKSNNTKRFFESEEISIKIFENDLFKIKKSNEKTSNNFSKINNLSIMSSMNFSHSKSNPNQSILSEKMNFKKDNFIYETGSIKNKNQYSISKLLNKPKIEGIMESKNEEEWNSYISHVSNSSQSKTNSIIKN